jgi:signal transduction histidine kinase
MAFMEDESRLRVERASAAHLSSLIEKLAPPGVPAAISVSRCALESLTRGELAAIVAIGREALANAIEHGQPSKVAFDLRRSDGLTVLTVQDDGRGFEMERTARGRGLSMMEAYSAVLGGRLLVLSIPGMGTTVQVALPGSRDQQRRSANTSNELRGGPR